MEKLRNDGNIIALMVLGKDSLSKMYNDDDDDDNDNNNNNKKGIVLEMMELLMVGKQRGKRH